MRDKVGFSLDQHEELALEIQAMRDRFVQIEVHLRRVYPDSTGELANRCWKQIDQLRCHLDDLANLENPGPLESPAIYFRSDSLPSAARLSRDR